MSIDGNNTGLSLGGGFAPNSFSTTDSAITLVQSNQPSVFSPPDLHEHLSLNQKMERLSLRDVRPLGSEKFVSPDPAVDKSEAAIAIAKHHNAVFTNFHMADYSVVWSPPSATIEHS